LCECNNCKPGSGSFKDFEDPDDMPPLDKGLNEIGITINDFKI
jgi:hypothetical protein